MPEAAVVEQPVTQPVVESPGWMAGLPSDLKTNAELSTYKTVGDFTKDALTWKSKSADLETKLKDSVPKLPDDATEEDRALYYDALGRPAKASEYELDGEDKAAPDQLNPWKEDFHKIGLTKQQAAALSKTYNERINKLVDDYKAGIAKEHTAAEQALRKELGDKYDTSVELAKRMYTKHLGAEFDAGFADASPAARFSMIKLLLKVASLTGEDTSPQSGHGADTKKLDSTGAWMNMYKNPKPGIAPRK